MPGKKGDKFVIIYDVGVMESLSIHILCTISVRFVFIRVKCDYVLRDSLWYFENVDFDVNQITSMTQTR